MMKYNLLMLFLLINYSCLFSQNTDLKNKGKRELAVVVGLDNDLFVSSDDYYTNGIFLGLIYSSKSFEDSPLPRFFGRMIDHIPGLKPDGDKIAYCGLSFAHRIFTPADIEDKNLIKDDIPYSGQLVFNFSASTQNSKHLNAWTLSLGVTGPLAGAEEIQKFVHRIVDSVEPLGWEHQIENEFLGNLFYEHRYRAFEYGKTSRNFDVMIVGASGLGNITSYVEAGIGFRVGSNIPDDFFVPTPFFADPTIGILPTTRDKNGFACYLFGNISGSLVANTIILDGNTFQDSHSVNYDPYGVRIVGGLVVEFKGFHIIGTVTYATIPWDNPKNDQADLFAQISFFCVF